MNEQKRRTQSEIRMLLDAVNDNWHVMDAQQKSKELYGMLVILFNYINEQNTITEVKLDKRRNAHLSLSRRVGQIKHTLDCITDA